MHSSELKLYNNYICSKLKLKHVGKLFSIQDIRGFEMFGLILDVFSDSESILHEVLSKGEIWVIDLSEYKIKFYDDLKEPRQ